MSQTMLIAEGSDVLLWVLISVGPLLALYGGWQLVNDLKMSNKKKISERLRSRTRTTAAKATPEELRRSAPKLEGVLANMIGGLKITEKLQSTLDQANIPWTASKVLMNLTLVASILLALTVALGLSILVGLGVAAAAYIFPILYMFHARKKRLKKFVLQLPDVFELLSQALRAGHSLASGMQLIAKEMPEPGGTEFGRVFHEQNLGLKIEDALLNMANRMDVLDVRFFVTAVLIQRQTGGDLAEVLDKIGSVIRDRIKLHGTVQALTAEGRLSGYVLLALPVLVFLAMLKINYEYATVLFTDPTGQMMAIAAIVMMIMGWVMIKKIVNINV